LLFRNAAIVEMPTFNSRDIFDSLLLIIKDF
jgi:hypothetical protein